MTSDISFSVDRHRTEWENLVYTCRECGASGEAVAALPHDNDCFVSQSDDVAPYETDMESEEWELPFSDSTVTLLQEIVRDVEYGMNGEEFDLESLTEFLSEKDGVRWMAQGSSHRLVLGLGRTSPRGEFHLQDKRGIVMKIDPRVRFDEEYTPVSSNIDELFTWETAVETETEMFFADLLAAAPDGMWLAMEYCIPVSVRIRSEMNDRDMIFDRNGNEYIDPLRGALAKHGWMNPDWKHGNIGLTDNDVPVLLDYGTGPDFQGEGLDE